MENFFEVIFLRRKNRFREIELSIYLFIYIFGPPFFYKTNYILACLSVLLILLQYPKRWWTVIKKSGMLSWIIAMIVLVFYVVGITFFNIFILREYVQWSHYISLYNRYLTLTFVSIFSTIYIICFLEKHNISWNRFIELLINAGIIESIITVLSFLSPMLKELLITTMLKYGGSSLYENEWYITVRSYGFASTLVDLFGLGMGMLAGISFYYGMNRKKRYIIFSLLIAMAGTLNARTTIVIYLLGICFVFLVYIKKMQIKRLFKYIICMTLLGGGLAIVLPYILSVNNATSGWLLSGIESIQNIMKGEETSNNFSTFLLSASWWELPNGIQLLFGTGHSRYGAEGYEHTDIGYVNDIWFIGILGVCFVYGVVVLIALYKYRNNFVREQKFIIIFLLFSTLIFNVKGAVIGCNMGALTLFTVIYVTNYMSTKKRSLLLI